MFKIAVIGTGVMGIGIAQTFAANNHKVLLKSMNNNGHKAFSKLDLKLSKLVEKDKMSQQNKEAIINNIEVITDDCQLSDCDLAIEAVSEDIEVKREVFNFLENFCSPNTIFATNTSSLSVTELASYTQRPEKVVGMHFFNPAPLMKLVEIIRALQTSDSTFKFVEDLTLSIEKTPVEINEAPGFVVNRMLIPMINEAIGIYAEGIASIEAIDKAMVLGANHPMGPLALGDLIGLDVCLNIMDVLYKETGDSKYRAHSLLRKYVRVGWLGRKTKKGFHEYN